MKKFLLPFIGTDQKFTFICTNYIYSGQIENISKDTVVSKNAQIIFETGPINQKGWRNSEDFPHLLFIARQSIESYFILDK